MKNIVNVSNGKVRFKNKGSNTIYEVSELDCYKSSNSGFNVYIAADAKILTKHRTRNGTVMDASKLADTKELKTDGFDAKKYREPMLFKVAVDRSLIEEVDKDTFRIQINEGVIFVKKKYVTEEKNCFSISCR